MAFTSKLRSQLRGIAAGEDTIIQIGKGGITDAVIALRCADSILL